MTLYELAICVKRGVKLLDRKVPNWRQTLRKHREQFDFADGDHCILGTLEHYSGRLQTLRVRKSDDTDLTTFGRAASRLRVFNDPFAYGFDADVGVGSPSEHLEQLSALWQAEFEPSPV